MSTAVPPALNGERIGIVRKATLSHFCFVSPCCGLNDHFVGPTEASTAVVVVVTAVVVGLALGVIGRAHITEHLCVCGSRNVSHTHDRFLGG